MEDRLCTLCEFDEVEDEYHFLVKCSLYSDLRNVWIRNITDKTPDFVEMDTTTNFKVIFAVHCGVTAKFILRSYNVRKKYSIQIMMYMYICVNCVCSFVCECVCVHVYRFIAIQRRMPNIITSVAVGVQSDSGGYGDIMSV